MIKALPLLAVSCVVLATGCGSPADSKQTSSVAVEGSGSGASGSKSIPLLSNLTPQELAAQCDVEVYPGAKFPDKQTKQPNKDEAGKVHSYLVMSTNDSPSKVVEFYVKGSKYSELKTKDGSEVQGLSPKGNLVLIDITTTPAGLTIISVKSVAG